MLVKWIEVVLLLTLGIYQIYLIISFMKAYRKIDSIKKEKFDTDYSQHHYLDNKPIALDSKCMTVVNGEIDVITRKTATKPTN